MNFLKVMLILVMLALTLGCSTGDVCGVDIEDETTGRILDWIVLEFINPPYNVTPTSAMVDLKATYCGVEYELLTMMLTGRIASIEDVRRIAFEFVRDYLDVTLEDDVVNNAEIWITNDKIYIGIENLAELTE